MRSRLRSAAERFGHCPNELRKRQHRRHRARKSCRRWCAGNDGFALGYGNDDRHARGRAADRRNLRARRRGVPGADRDGGECAGARACQPALGRGVRACRGAYPDRRMRRAGILRRRVEARRHAGRRLQGDARDARRDGRALRRPRPASGRAGGVLVRAGERGRHHLPAGRDRGAGQDRACTTA